MFIVFIVSIQLSRRCSLTSWFVVLRCAVFIVFNSAVTHVLFFSFEHSNIFYLIVSTAHDGTQLLFSPWLQWWHKAVVVHGDCHGGVILIGRPSMWVATCAGSQSRRASKEEFGPAGVVIMTSGGMSHDAFLFVRSACACTECLCLCWSACACACAGSSVSFCLECLCLHGCFDVHPF